MNSLHCERYRPSVMLFHPQNSYAPRSKRATGSREAHSCGIGQQSKNSPCIKLRTIQETTADNSLRNTVIGLTKVMEQNPYLEAASYAVNQKFLKFYATRRFITVLTRVLHWSLS
jgi:hypothetical protein